MAIASRRIPARVRAALRSSRADISRTWTGKHWAFVALVAAAALVPAVAGDVVSVRALALVFYYALAAVGLNLVMGLGNMASIGHGAFVAIGALIATELRTDASLSLPLAVVAAVVATIAVADVVGRGAVRLRAVQLAVSSWLGAWLVALAMAAFPRLSGGAGGVPIPDVSMGHALGLAIRATPLLHYEVSIAFLVAGLLAYRALQTGPVGLTMATIKQNPREAAAIGTLRDDLRLGVFVFGAALAGLAGALTVQLSGIFDQSAFGVLLSVALFLAVLLGGPGRTFAPLIGVAVIALLPLPGQPLEPLMTSSRAGELLPGLLLLGVVAVRARLSSEPAIVHTAEAATPTSEHENVDVPRLEIDGVTKAFGGLVALENVSLRVDGGSVHGIIGPNGSGKSTLLKVISGHVFPDGGSVRLGDRDLTRLPALERLRSGVARSPQSTELFPQLTPVDHVVAAGLVHRRYAGFLRTLFRTPRARLEERFARTDARHSLSRFGLDGYANSPASSMPAGARRTLMIAVAAIGKRVVLLDEPSAGMTMEETGRLAETLTDLKAKGMTIVVVEHNLRLLRSVADAITVLDGGKVIAQGDPEHIYEHPDVRAAYLGAGGR
jgi:ABC-type branched-subunit amino acid transport system ATPase component/ABC-type branched-subunit amino acid transport system permease subunit